YVLSLGTLEPRKDVPGLLAAFERLAGSHPGLRLVVAGPDGWGTAAFEQALGRSPFADRVVRLGYLGQAERAGLLRGAAVFAYPSVYEGFGLPPLEAMAVGVPVVCTRAGALPEVVGQAALLVEPGDPEALAGAIACLLDDQAARARLIEAGRRRAAEFSWGSCAAGLEALYRRAAAER
ncbi:MAG TPA: glycosyltransferase family 1 protein, partial [Acidimicrobiales bacterium]|nr:glycosyltransferase family 1 protein [Acidimicrobiales bacterium]